MALVAVNGTDLVAGVVEDSTRSAVIIQRPILEWG